MASKTILTVIRRAQHGDTDSQYRLGCVYLDGGEGLARNERTAYMWLSRAADQGCEPAWRVIGERISPHVAPGDPQLTRWYSLAAAAGSLIAKRKLAQTMLAGDAASNGDRQRERARLLLEDAAGAGDAEACGALGRLLLASPSARADVTTACRLLERAWQRGYREAARELADHYWNERHAALARMWYERCPDEDDPELCYRLGVLNVFIGLPSNKLLERAAEAGHLAACEELGFRLATGSREHRRDLKKATRWLEPAASQGSPRAAYLLATICRHPGSGAHDSRRARRWLFRAARNGHGEACLHAGKALVRQIDSGRGLPVDELGSDKPELTAAKYLLTAARQGFGEANDLLTRLIRAIPSEFQRCTDHWGTFIGAVQRKDVEIGARLKLGFALGLSARELLAIDPTDCDHGDYFIVSIPGRRALRRRIVLVTSQNQRRLIDEAKAMLEQLANGRDDEPEAEDFRSRYLKLRHLSRQVGHPLIDAALFPRSRHPNVHRATNSH